MSAEPTGDRPARLGRLEAHSLREMLRAGVRDQLAGRERAERFPLDAASTPTARLEGPAADQLEPALREWGVRTVIGGEPGCAILVADSRGSEAALPAAAGEAELVFFISHDRAAAAAALRAAGHERVAVLEPPADADRSLISRELAVVAGER